MTIRSHHFAVTGLLLALGGCVVAPPPTVMHPTCQQFTQNITVGGKSVPGYGLECLQPDGKWAVAIPPGPNPIPAGTPPYPPAGYYGYNGYPGYDNAYPYYYGPGYYGPWYYGPGAVGFGWGWGGGYWGGGWGRGGWGGGHGWGGGGGHGGGGGWGGHH